MPACAPRSEEYPAMKLLTVTEAAVHLHLSESTVRALCHSRKLRHQRYGMWRGAIRIPDHSLRDDRRGGSRVALRRSSSLLGFSCSVARLLRPLPPRAPAGVRASPLVSPSSPRRRISPSPNPTSMSSKRHSTASPVPLLPAVLRKIGPSGR